MSPDNVFAAQMWSWPDPMIKRDEFGRVIFLNAAFLSLYGGRVEDWQGNIVTGWPAPHVEQGINRFETNLATPNGEYIFDWLEYSHGEGHALAIARDVTAFVGRNAVAEVAPAEQHAPEMAHPEMAHAGQNHGAVDTAYQAQLAHQAAQDLAYQNAITAQDSQAHEIQAHAETAQPAVQNVPYEAAPIEAPLAQPVTAEAQYAPAAELPPMPEAAPAAPIEPQAQAVAEHADAPVLAEPEAPQETVEVRERDIERRALPIENQDSVLGTNWRDAVIARAVSTEENVEEPDASSEASVAAPIETESQAPTSGHRILLAEDNAINALLTRTLLEAEGCTVDVVEDGALAVEAVKNANYDMIFMDMRMPNMDGLEATRKIRSLPNTDGGLPIIALTANAFDDDRNACFDSGMNDFMTKPVSAEELSAMVSTWAVKTEAAA